MKNNESFKSVVKGIKKSEKRVDEVLSAARLERVEKPQMTDARLEIVFTNVLLITVTVLGFGFLTMFFYMAMR